VLKMPCPGSGHFQPFSHLEESLVSITPPPQRPRTNACHRDHPKRDRARQAPSRTNAEQNRRRAKQTPSKTNAEQHKRRGKQTSSTTSRPHRQNSAHTRLPRRQRRARCAPSCPDSPSLAPVMRSRTRVKESYHKRNQSKETNQPTRALGGRVERRKLMSLSPLPLPPSISLPGPRLSTPLLALSSPLLSSTDPPTTLLRETLNRLSPNNLPALPPRLLRIILASSSRQTSWLNLWCAPINTGPS
jgi:hypothetical protein